RKKIPVMNSKQWVQLKNLAWKNAAKYDLQGSIPNTYKIRANHHKLFNSQGQPIYNTDWQEKGVQTAMSNRHHLFVGGGAEKTNYGVGLGYENLEGIILYSNSKSYTGRFYVHTQITDWLKAAGSINYNITNQQQPQP